jgi:hypothetical protein
VGKHQGPRREGGRVKVYDFPQRSPEWYSARLGKLTASDAKYITAFLKNGDESAARRDLKMRLVCERLTGQPAEDAYVNADMQRGIDLEPEAFAAYEAKTGLLVNRVGFVAHDDLMTGGSPDGVVGDFEGLVEIKCPRPANHLRYLRTGVYDEHIAQITHLLWLTGAQWCTFVSYCPSFPENMRLYTTTYALTESQLVTHSRDVHKFLNEVDLEEASLKGWSVMKETA